jgi:hypothetical protein
MGGRTQPGVRDRGPPVGAGSGGEEDGEGSIWNVVRNLCCGATPRNSPRPQPRWVEG